MQTNPEQWAVDVRYLAKLVYWASGEGFCQLKDMDDPDEWCFAKWNELKPESNGDDYSADTLAVALIASIQAAFAEREARLVGALGAHNDVLRSASQVAYRDGKDTNWLTLRGAITYTLAEHYDTVNEARATLNDSPLTDKIEVTAEDIAAWEKYGPKIFNCEMTGPEALASHRRATLAALKDRTNG